MKIVHIQTKLNTIFGVMDDEDNIIATTPAEQTVHRIDVESFGNLADALATVKADLVKQLDEALAQQQPHNTAETFLPGDPATAEDAERLLAEGKAEASVEEVLSVIESETA